MEREINVLSLFDGMSCGQVALNRANIPYKNYFASEIKKRAIEVTQYNYPNTIQLGDIKNIKSCDLPKIDLLIAGSPCQDFSRANCERKGLEGEKSKLFYEFLRILKECKPRFFLLENVIMENYNYWKICKELNCEPVRLCGSLVSAALRDRYYWTNIPPFSVDLFGRLISNIPPPRDKKIYLNSILETGHAKKRKHNCLNTTSGGHREQQDLIHRNNTTGMITLIYEGDRVRTISQVEMERLHNIPFGYTRILDRSQAGDLIGDGWTIDIIKHIFTPLRQLFWMDENKI